MISGSGMKSICVFMGSSPGLRPEYRDAAVELGRELARRRMRLVYGGAGIGLMAAVANTVLEHNGHVTGVIPQALVDKEVAHTSLPDLRVVKSMHERKALMADLADGFIALPGGMGTLEELCETLTWAQLGLHSKPCGLLDVCDYYHHFKEFLEHSVRERFLKPQYRRLLVSAARPAELLDLLEKYEPVHLPKWIDRETA